MCALYYLLFVAFLGLLVLLFVVWLYLCVCYSCLFVSLVALFVSACLLRFVVVCCVCLISLFSCFRLCWIVVRLVCVFVLVCFLIFCLSMLLFRLCWVVFCCGAFVLVCLSLSRVAFIALLVLACFLVLSYCVEFG